MSRPSPFSWIFRRSTSSSSSATAAENGISRKAEAPPGRKRDEEELGVTEELQEFVRNFTVDTFRGHSLLQPQDGERDHLNGDDRSMGAVKADNVRKDLTDWQERHAVLVLSRVKEMSKLRYVLCPRHMKENQFWQVYFLLVKTHVSPYEIRAIQKEKLKKMEQGEEKSPDNGAIEVEMTETNPLKRRDASQSTG